jgi:3-oxoadipate CoA-transferase beta subunit
MSWTMAQAAARLARDLPEGSVVNLGIGLPTLIADFLPAGREILLHSENGILGLGPGVPESEVDWDIIDAGKRPVSLVPGAAVFHHADSFAMIRGGHIDVAVLGAYEVSRAGDLANWAVDDGTSLPGVGGAMDLAAGARQVYVLSRHTRADGSPKLVETCSLPLTAPAAVNRFYSDLAIIEFGATGPSVIGLAPGVDFDDVQELTGTALARTTSE